MPALLRIRVFGGAGIQMEYSIAVLRLRFVNEASPITSPPGYLEHSK